MIGYTQMIEIKDIIFLTANNEITLSGIVKRNTMSFETQMLLDATQLNLVINQLQRINPENAVSEMFESRNTGNGESLFFFDAFSLENCTLEVDSFTQNQPILQIRA